MCSLRKILSCTLWNLRLIQKPAVLPGIGAGFSDLFLLDGEDCLAGPSLWNQYPGRGTLCMVFRGQRQCPVCIPGSAASPVTDSAPGCASVLPGIPRRTEKLDSGASSYNDPCQHFLYGVSADFNLPSHVGPCFIVQRVERYCHGHELCAGAV